MKAVVAREVSTLVLKPASTSSQPTESGSHIRFDGGKAKRAAQPKVETTGHARYYGLITLNQMTLTTKDKEVAGRMVDLYFEVFREIWGNGMQVNHGDEPDEGEEVDQEKVEKVAGRVDRWRGRRKGAQPRGGKKTALESEELVETGDSKLVAAVLTGINRALPFAKLDEEA
jgi:ribosome biogenesis protein MAK21